MPALKSGPRCHECPLKDAPGPVWGEGPPSTKLAAVGQCPGPTEIEEGKPFAGTSGTLYNKGLFSVGIKREEVFTSNVVKCFIQPGKPVPKKAIACCLPLLYKELDCLPNLQVKITMGLEAFNSITGKELHLIHARKQSRKKPNYWVRGYPFRKSTEDSCPIIPLEHPASILRGGYRSLPYWESDWRKVRRWYDGKGFLYKEEVNEDPSEKEVQLVLEEIFDTGWGGLDIETSEGAVEESDLIAKKQIRPNEIGISSRIGHAINLKPHKFNLLNPLFSGKHSEVIICAFNKGFDAFYCGEIWNVENVRWYDPMLALNLLYSDLMTKDLGMALSMWTDMPFHKNLQDTNPPLYNLRDTYGALWAAQESYEQLKNNEMAEVFWEGEMPLIPIVEDLRNIGMRCDVEYAQRAELTCYKQLQVYEKWWEEKIPLYSWSSPQQLLKLFTEKMKLPVRMRLRTRTKDKTKYRSPSTDDEVLEEYRDKFDNKVAGLVLEMRRLKKAADFTHIFEEDGRCHAAYKIHGQKQGRLQASNPDVQNIPEEAAGIRPRRIIVGDRDDHVVIVADWSQIELRIYAALAQDLPWLEAFRRGDYIHGIVYEEINPGELFFEAGKPKEKQFRLEGTDPKKLLVAKSCPLGFIYGRGPDSMVNLGVSKAKGQAIFDKLKREHTAVYNFHEKLKFHAYREGYYRNPFGRMRRFPNVKMQLNELLSCPGQSTAADVLRQYALIPFHHGANSRHSLSNFKHGDSLAKFGARPIFTVHDSQGVTCPRSNVKDCAQFMKEVMESPIKELNELSIPIELKAGPSWDEGVLLEKWLKNEG